MTTPLEAMKQALEALKRRAEWSEQDAITNLTAALEAAEKQEPVAWMGEYNINNIRDHYTVVMRNKTDFDKLPERLRPLYTTPQQPAIPDGWVLVPVEPTEEMAKAFASLPTSWASVTFSMKYKAMLAAAPKEMK